MYPLTLEDFPALEAIYSDPEVMRFLSEDGKPWPTERLRQRLQGWISDQQRLGYSKWKVCLRSSGQMIGRAGFGIFEETGETELGYSFAKAFWGHGYATECASAALDWIFAHTNLSHVIAFAAVENLGSRRVLEKIGMEFSEIRPWKGTPNAFYRCSRPGEGASR